MSHSSHCFLTFPFPTLCALPLMLHIALAHSPPFCPSIISVLRGLVRLTTTLCTIRDEPMHLRGSTYRFQLDRGMSMVWKTNCHSLLCRLHSRHTGCSVPCWCRSQSTRVMRKCWLLPWWQLSIPHSSILLTCHHIWVHERMKPICRGIWRWIWEVHVWWSHLCTPFISCKGCCLPVLSW
jgi:hypothetical protein